MGDLGRGRGGDDGEREGIGRKEGVWKQRQQRVVGALLFLCWRRRWSSTGGREGGRGRGQGRGEGAWRGRSFCWSMPEAMGRTTGPHVLSSSYKREVSLVRLAAAADDDDGAKEGKEGGGRLA